MKKIVYFLVLLSFALSVQASSSSSSSAAQDRARSKVASDADIFEKETMSAIAESLRVQMEFYKSQLKATQDKENAQKDYTQQKEDYEKQMAQQKVKDLDEIENLILQVPTNPHPSIGIIVTFKGLHIKAQEMTFSEVLYKEDSVLTIFRAIHKHTKLKPHNVSICVQSLSGGLIDLRPSAGKKTIKDLISGSKKENDRFVIKYSKDGRLSFSTAQLQELYEINK